MIRPGLCSVTFRSLPVEEVVRHAASAGLEGIEWAGDAHVPPGDLDAATHARTVTEEAGLAVRVPDWWRVRKPPRPTVRVQLGADTPHELGVDGLLDFSVDVAVDGARSADRRVTLSQGLCAFGRCLSASAETSTTCEVRTTSASGE